jgi:hypothetical protein
VTGYVFLYKGFEWPQEPGKVQRFMWWSSWVTRVSLGCQNEAHVH